MVGFHILIDGGERELTGHHLGEVDVVALQHFVHHVDGLVDLVHVAVDV